MCISLHMDFKQGHQGKRADRIVEVLEDPWVVLKRRSAFIAAGEQTSSQNLQPPSVDSS